MVGEADKYTRAAAGIESGSLSKAAGEAISDIEIARMFSKDAAFKENALQMGQLGGSVAGYQFKSASAFQNFNKQMLKRMSEGKTSKMFDMVMHIALMDGIHRQLADLDIVMEQTEESYAETFGEDWREQFALEILDPDDIPQREAGESMEDYRERLEDTLMKEMLNEDGSIKEEYKDDPRASEWAQVKFDRERLQKLEQNLSDPSISDEERQRLIQEYNQSGTAARTGQAGETLEEEQTAGLETHDTNDPDTLGAGASTVSVDFMNS
ncbi:hypothetical protein [uncultured Sneathiella sp.]|uniref:hypothetical protein n=1 Tax=uncultured Sneathiella sp. TaxID=879315 RepID=UPI0030EF095E